MLWAESDTHALTPLLYQEFNFREGVVLVSMLSIFKADTEMCLGKIEEKGREKKPRVGGGGRQRVRENNRVNVDDADDDCGGDDEI